MSAALTPVPSTSPTVVGMSRPGIAQIRLATEDDVPSILDIANWYAHHSPANFAVAPEPLDMWRTSWREQQEWYPWLVACAADPSPVPRGSPGAAASSPAALPTFSCAPRSADAIVGFAKASPFRTRCAYRWSVETSVYLRDGWGGRGLGRDLYDRLLAILRRQGYRKVIGGITLPNAASVKLHERCGYRHVGSFVRIGWKFGRWHDVGFWELEFDGGEESEPSAALRPVRECLPAGW